MRKLFLFMMLILPTYTMAQSVTLAGDPSIVPAAKTGDVKPTNSTAPKPEDKKTPETFAIPDARKDKVAILQKDVELIGFRMAELERQFKEQQALQRQAADKWTAELMSAMKLAGVEEKDFGLYEYNRETMTFTKKKAEAPTPKKEVTENPKQ